MSSTITRIAQHTDEQLRASHGWILLAAATAGVISFCSCIAPSQLDQAAERATYEAIAPDYLRYVQADPALSAEDKARRARTIETWAIRLNAQEQPK